SDHRGRSQERLLTEDAPVSPRRTSPLIRRRHAKGLTLVEMMVAMLIASFLIFGLLQVFTASKASYQTAEGLARVQENARFALDFLQRDIRMAGHFGCVNDQAHWVRAEDDPMLHFGTVPT